MPTTPNRLKTIKPGVSIAKRRMMARMVPLTTLIAEQKARIEKISERIGQLMSKRADEEEILADLYTFESKRLADSEVES